MTEITDEMVELKPCPFCGGPAKLNRAPWGPRIHCENDACAGRWIEADPAAWNRRAALSPAPQALAGEAAAARDALAEGGRDNG